MLCNRSFLVIFLLFRATPAAYGSSQARAELELQLKAYTTATVMGDLCHVCDLCLGLWQCQILNLLSEARDWIHILMETNVGSLTCWATMGTPSIVCCFSGFFCFFFFCFLGPHLQHMEVSGLGVRCSWSLCHSQGNTRSELHLWPAPQLLAMMDP